MKIVPQKERQALVLCSYRESEMPKNTIHNSLSRARVKKHIYSSTGHFPLPHTSRLYYIICSLPPSSRTCAGECVYYPIHVCKWVRFERVTTRARTATSNEQRVPPAPRHVSRACNHPSLGNALTRLAAPAGATRFRVASFSFVSLVCV